MTSSYFILIFDPLEPCSLQA